jgi:hypothetical protein
MARCTLAPAARLPDEVLMKMRVWRAGARAGWHTGDVQRMRGDLT